MNVVLLAGSPSAPSTTWRLLQLVGERLTALGHATSPLQVRELPQSWSSAQMQLQHSLAEDEPELSRALREGSPATWAPTGMGAAVPGATAQFGAGVA